jgi:V8-like Glu-specific endopeptidase
MTLWDGVRALVGDDETEPALDQLEVFLKGRTEGGSAARVRQLLDEVVMLRARVRRLAAKIRQNVVTASEAEAERARQDRSILALISEIERMDLLRPPAASIRVPEEIVAEKLMGAESQLRSTGWLAEGLRIASAVCRLNNGRVLGTGFRCRDDLLITNHHVIGASEDARSFRAEFFFEEGPNGALLAPFVVALEPDRLFWTDERLDVTIVGLSGIDRADIAVVPLLPDASAKVRDHVSIVQHPSGGPKQIAVTNNQILNFYDPYVQYLTDTLPGSSGAPVFLDSWKVLAIHHAGGNVRKSAQGDVIFANEGIMVSSLFTDAGFRSVYLGNAA